MTRAEAEELRDTVNAALDAAERVGVVDSVNWADLECRDVEERTSLLTGANTIVVLIEEASPNAINLRDYVAEWLAAKGWRDVFVETEW